MTQTATPKAPEAKAAKPAAPAAAKPATKAKLGNMLWGDEVIRVDVIADEKSELLRHDRLIRIITMEAIAIGVLGVILILGVPFFHPIYQYFAMNPEHERMALVGLTVPNMTNRAILSWATTSITEIMTMGFGDYESHLKGQKYRFTEAGWESFATAFDKQKIGESFKKHQLVLTTVPSNAPVILGQGENAQHIYQWNVQLPVVMTYATNNNVSRRQSSVIELEIVRVPPEQSPSGIGIKSWSIGSAS